MYECEIMGIVSARVLQLLSFSGACNVMISRGMAAPITSKFVAVHETWRPWRPWRFPWGIPWKSPN